VCKDWIWLQKYAESKEGLVAQLQPSTCFSALPTLDCICTWLAEGQEFARFWLGHGTRCAAILLLYVISRVT